MKDVDRMLDEEWLLAARAIRRAVEHATTLDHAKYMIDAMIRVRKNQQFIKRWKR